VVILAKGAIRAVKAISKENFFNTHAKRLGLGFLVLIQAFAFGILGGVIYYWMVMYGLWFAAIILIIMLIYLAGMYEEKKSKKIAAKNK
jgi:hypothetical protein